MPTNLPAEALAARQKHEEANSLEERITTLRDYLSKIPKHKGTDKLRLILRGRLAKFQEELESKEKHRKQSLSGGRSPWSVERQNAGLVTLVGQTNTGKTTLLNNLTGTNGATGEYPFTTTIPEVGGAKFEDIVITIVDLPAIVEGASIGKNNGPQIMGIIRNSQVIGIVIDLSQDTEAQLQLLLSELESVRIRVNEESPPVKIAKISSGGLQILGKDLFEGDLDDLQEFLRESGFINARIQFDGRVNFDDLALAVGEKPAYRRAVLIGAKGDIKGSSSAFQSLKDKWEHRFPVIGISALKSAGIENLLSILFQELQIIRIFTKQPGKEPTIEPMILNVDDTIRDLAKLIHKSFISSFRYARVFGASVKHQGAKVGLDHVLQDKDIVEIRIN